MARGIPFVHLILVASVAALPEQGWSDHTGASFSEGNVITCVLGVLCRCGFSRRGPEEICESSFECTPAEAVAPVVAPGPPVEPAQVPGVPTEPGPVLPVPSGSPSSQEGVHNSGNESGQGVKPEAPKAPKAPKAPDASNASAPLEVPAAKPEIANSTVHHVPNISSEPQMSNSTVPLVPNNVSGLSNTSTRPQLRGSAGKAQELVEPEEPRRLHSWAWWGRRRKTLRPQGHKISCPCGVACQWGHRMEGERRVCHGPLHCEPCMPRHTRHGSCGGA